MLHLVKHADRSGDQLDDGSWPLSHVELIGDPPAVWGAADTFVARAAADGYLRFENMRIGTSEAGGVPYPRDPVITGDSIVLELEGGDLRYRVVEHPGRYLEADGSIREVHEYQCELVTGKAAKDG